MTDTRTDHVATRARRASVALTVLVVVAFATACVGGPPAPPARDTSSASYEERTELEIVALANAERNSRGLPTLQWDTQLARLAQDWSRTMASTGNLAHRNLQAAFGGLVGFERLGENILVSSCGVAATDMHRMWMNSPTHRAVLLDGGYNRIGVGVVCTADGRAWATTNFGRR